MSELSLNYGFQEDKNSSSCRKDKNLIDSLIVETVSKKIAGNPLTIPQVEEKLYPCLNADPHPIYKIEGHNTQFPTSCAEYKTFAYEYIKERYFYYRKNLNEFAELKNKLQQV